MTNSKLTRRALLTSVMALVLCFAMLTGTTFAWFTDQETSGNNRIVAGNLDVDLLMYNGTEYASIANGNGDIFQEGATANNSSATLWEPGKTQIAYLAIENKGNLDLKYKVELNVKDPENGKLYEVMTYTITPDAKNGDLPAWDATKAIDVKLGKQDVSEEVKLGNGATHYFALSIHMDEEAGNDYMKDYLIFDITVYATQLDSESDAFDNQYDADAFFDLSQDENGAYLLGSATDLLAFNAALNEEGTIGGEGRVVNIKLTADIDMAGRVWEPVEDMWFVFDGDGHTISNLTTASARKAGLFGYAGAVTIKNLTIENANVTGSQAGIFAGAGEALTIDNCFLKGQNTVTFIESAETWNGVGALTGVLVNSTVDATIVDGTTVTINKGAMTTDAGCVYIDDITGYVSANKGTVINNGTISVIETPVDRVVEGVAVKMTASAYDSITYHDRTGYTDKVKDVTVYTKEDLDAVVTLRNAGVIVHNGRNDIAAELYFGANIDYNGENFPGFSKGININGNGYTLSNVKFIAGADGKAGFIPYAGNNIIKDLTIKDAVAEGAQAGIFAGNASTVTITNCALAGDITVKYVDSAEEDYNGLGAVFGVHAEDASVINVDVTGATITIVTDGITYPTGYSAESNNLVGVVYGGSYEIK